VIHSRRSFTADLIKRSAFRLADSYVFDVTEGQRLDGFGLRLHRRRLEFIVDLLPSSDAEEASLRLVEIVENTLICESAV
jgi:hypothetical protein